MNPIQWATSPWGQSVPVPIAWYLIWVSAIAGLGFLIVHAIWVAFLAKPEVFQGHLTPAQVAAIPEEVPRHSLAARLFHWIMAAAMLTLLITAFLPKVGVQFAWVQWHWIAGIVLITSIIFHIIHASFFMDFWSVWPEKVDIQDAMDRGKMMMGKSAPLPRRFAKYPFENKLYHLIIVLTGLTVACTGFFMLFRVRTPFFTRNPYLFGDMTWGMMYVLHGLAGVGLIALVTAHIYMTLRLEKLVITRSMVVGTLKREEFVEFRDPERWNIGSDTPFNSMPLRSLAFAVTALTLAFGCGELSAQQRPSEASSPSVPSPPPLPTILQNYQPVTAERLKNPEPSNWLQIRGEYSGWGYSELTQINTKNVRQLHLAWVFATGAVGEHEAAPLVNNGVMYVSAPGNQVLAINAQTGSLLWRYRKEVPAGAIVMHPTSRGVALFGDKVYFASNTAVLVALDAKTGKEVWTTTVADNKQAYYMSGDPMVADGKLMVGVSGGEWGIRGFVAAYDLETGKELWRTYTIPAPGEPGSETWPSGDQWKTGGGPTWIAGNYDPVTNLLYWGVGNGGPWMGDLRPGDDLYTSSTIVLDASTGNLMGYHQYDPNESFDWDEVSPPLLIDFNRSGKTVEGLIDVARDGYMFYLDRTPQGPINFVNANPYVLQTVFKDVDPKTGRIEYNEEHKPGVGKTADFCPMYLGGKNWQYAAFSPKTRMIYIPTSANLCSTMTGQKPTYIAGSTYTGGRSQLFIAPGADHIGETQAWNVDTGKKVWSYNFENSSNWGSLLVTASGLVFGGGTADRMFRALDASTGKLLWQMPTSSGVMGQPSTFMVDGRQYVAVMTGWGGDARGVQSHLNAIRSGEFPEVPDGGSIWVFTPPGK